MPSRLAEGSVDDDNTEAIAGGVIGGLVAAAVVVAIVVYVAMSVNKKKKAAVEPPVPGKDLLYGRQSTSTSLGSRSGYDAPPAITMPDNMGVRSMTREATVVSISMARVSPAPEDEEETWARPGSRCSTARTARMLEVLALTPEDTIHEAETERLA